MQLRRIAILGDIHAEDRRLEVALACAAERGVDAVLAVGDIVDGSGDAARCVRMLMEHGVHCVRGNHDRWWSKGKPMGFADGTPRDALPPEAVRWLADLPPTRSFTCEMGTVLLCHGLGDNDMVGVDPDDADYALEANHDLQALIDRADFNVVINGHTHLRMVRRVSRKLCIVNAGTLQGAKRAGFGIVDFGGRVVEWMEFREDAAVCVEKQAIE